jgi:hypothetical protein
MARQTKMSAAAPPAPVQPAENSTKPDGTVDSRQGLLAKIEQLEADNKRLEADSKRQHAESKIHHDAWLAEAEKFQAFSAMVDKERHDHLALQAKHAHVMKVIRTAESAYYENFTTHAVFEPNGGWPLYLQLVRAVQPVFQHRD